MSNDETPPECEACEHPARGRLIKVDPKLYPPGDIETGRDIYLCGVCYGSPASGLMRRSYRNIASSDRQDILKAISYAANEVIDAIERQGKGGDVERAEA